MTTIFIDGQPLARPPTGVIHRFEIQIGENDYTIDVDEALTPDDAFRDMMWPADELSQMAGHIIWNRFYRGYSHIEGLWPEQQLEGSYWRLIEISEGDPEVEVREIPRPADARPL